MSAHHVTYLMEDPAVAAKPSNNLSYQYPRVYIVIVNYNGWRDTIECLESVLRMNYDNFQVILVDNGSADGSLEKIKLWAEGALDVWLPDENRLKYRSYPPVTKSIPLVQHDQDRAESDEDIPVEVEPQNFPGTKAPVVLIESGRNLGFAGGNNVGIRYAMMKGDFQYIWLLNNDVVVEDNALAKLVERMRQKPKAGLCGSTLLFYDDPERVQLMAGGTYNKWLAYSELIGLMRSANAPVDVGLVESKLAYVCAASMLVSREFIDKVGLLCEDYFLYYEEMDWSMRSNGCFEMAYAPESIVYHKGGGSIGSNSDGKLKSEMADYYGNKSRIMFTRKFYPKFLPTVYLSFIAVILNRLRRRQWGRAWMVFKIMCYSVVGRDF